jgi:hypothetical protein
MNEKMYSVTYAVTFSEKFYCQGIYYHPGVEYFFTTLSEHPGDALDDAYNDYYRRFGCLDYEGNIVVENFKPLAGSPVIKEVKEVAL